MAKTTQQPNQTAQPQQPQQPQQPNPQQPKAAPQHQQIAGFSLLPTKRTPRKVNIAQQLYFIYGVPKIGKSTFAAQFPDALFLPTEPGLSHLDVYQAPPDGSGITSWAQLLNILQEVAEMRKASIAQGVKPPFQTLVIDTADAAYKLCVAHTCGARKIEHPGDLDRGKGYEFVNNEFERVMRRMMMLGFGVILISHAKEIEVKKGGVKWSKIVSTLPGSGRKIAASLADFILFCDVAEIDDAKAPGGKRRVRVIRTKPSVYYEAGDRQGFLPSVVPLDFGAFSAAYLEGIQKRKDLVSSGAVNASAQADLGLESEETTGEGASQSVEATEDGGESETPVDGSEAIEQE